MDSSAPLCSNEQGQKLVGTEKRQSPSVTKAPRSLVVLKHYYDSQLDKTSWNDWSLNSMYTRKNDGASQLPNGRTLSMSTLQCGQSREQEYISLVPNTIGNNTSNISSQSNITKSRFRSIHNKDGYSTKMTKRSKMLQISGHKC